MDDIKRKSLKEILPKRGLAIKERSLPLAKQVEAANYYQRRQGRGMSLFIWLFVIITLFGAAYYLSDYFTLITVKLTPKQLAVPADGQYQAEKTPSSAPLSFSVVTAEDADQMMIPVTGSQTVTKKATGRVVIYNDYSPASQQLLIGTRLQTASGKIFKLDQAVVVPGEKKSGSDLTPGSVEVKVTAEAAGSDYNVGLVDLRLVGFTGTAKYDKFVARSKTPLGGGQAGEVKIASESDKTKARVALQKTLTDRLVKKIKLQVPKDFVLFDNAIIVNPSDDTASSSLKAALTPATTTNQMAFGQRVNLVGILFNEQNLAQVLLSKASDTDSFKNDNLKIGNPNSLQFELLNQNSFDPNQTSKISFTLSGQVKLVWTINTDGLKTKLVGTSLKNKDQIFGSYPNIFKAETVVQPPWVINFPEDKSKIAIEIAPLQ